MIMMTWLELLLLGAIFGDVIYFTGFAFGAGRGAKNSIKILTRMNHYTNKKEEEKLEKQKNKV